MDNVEEKCLSEFNQELAFKYWANSYYTEK